jgi:nucleoside-diphosphate-sugar epimerase
MAFVTGGTGLVGARLIFDLVEKGESVVALKRKQTPVSKFEFLVSFYGSSLEKINEKVTWVDGDINDYDSLLAVIPENSSVFHCAAEVSFHPGNAKKILQSNVEGTTNVVNACLVKNVAKLCHVSSIGALGGKINGPIINEDTPWSPPGKSSYSLSKYYSELEVWRGTAEGLNAVIVNPAVILGPGDWQKGSPSLFHLAAKGQPFYTLGSTGYVDVRDVTRAMIYLMDSHIQSARFVLCAETLTYKELFTKIAHSLQVPPPRIYANRFLTSLAWRAEWVTSKLLDKEPKMTRQTHRVSHIMDVFNGNKITENNTFAYTPIEETLFFIAQLYQTSNQSVNF